MCGICGVASRYLEPGDLNRIVDRMVHTLVHRGPDGQGIVNCELRIENCEFKQPATKSAIRNSKSEIRNVALGHTRLAVIDLSEAGRQPMSNETCPECNHKGGTVWIVFNGEIYNFHELRAELEAKGHRFCSRTDTEVIIHAYAEWGTACVRRFLGMFAFAIYDGRPEMDDRPSVPCLFLARDPLGIKPLYYCALPGHFLFASEIKAILASGLYAIDVDWQALYDFFTYLYIPSPATAFQGIRQVPPGHILEVDLQDGHLHLERYWTPHYRVEIAKAPKAELQGQIRDLLSDSVQRQLVSDVPLGIFLSGGVDSPIVAGLAKEAGADVHTFTIVFEDNTFAFYNEQARARAIARHLGTDHTEIPVRDVDPWDLLDLVEYFDQPFGNPTFYLMYLISKYTRPYITVALCGAGGDELYAGYPRYQAVQWARRLRWVPGLLWRLGSLTLGLLRDSYRTMHLRRIREFVEGLDGDFIRQFCQWTYHLNEERKSRLLRFSSNRQTTLSPSDRVLRSAWEASPFPDEDNRLLHVDVQTFLVNNLLEYTDKMSMAVALEVRVPYLDHRFVELSLNIPFNYKLRNGHTKWILRETFADFFPSEVIHAPKRGFNVPLARWMLTVFDEYFEASRHSNHPLKERLGEDIGYTWKEGLLDWDYIQKLRAEHRRGKRDNAYELFGIIIFDIWWRKYITRTLPMMISFVDAQVEHAHP